MLFDDLKNRGLIKQCTNEIEIKNLLDNKKITFYIGFDPTADSLHVGHLLQLIFVKKLQQAGHHPIILLGGATALIGDPTGKSKMRPMLSFSGIDDNKESFSNQIQKIIGFQHIENNMLWFDNFSFLSFIKDIGIHFSVNNMLRAECFKSRLENGLSFLEFNYMLMQAFDFFKLHNTYDCILQIGGDDQWSNILAGIDLVHKKIGKKVFGLTLPLLVNSAGYKMGKTEKGAVWLSKDKTSVFDFFQFWRNLPDSDVINCLKMLTSIPVSEIDNLPFSNTKEINEVKKKLALDITKLVHGEDETILSLKHVEALFERNDLSSIDQISIEDNTNLLDLIIKSKFATTRTEAKNLIIGLEISINNETITNPTTIISKEIFGDNILLKKGKKSFCYFIIKDLNE